MSTCGCSQVGRASDIWSLGCILYQMVYGRTPFFHLGNMIQKMHAITNPDYHIDFPPTANPDLLHTMQRCLDRNPRTRATMQVLGRLLCCAAMLQQHQPNRRHRSLAQMQRCK